MDYLAYQQIVEDVDGEDALEDTFERLKRLVLSLSGNEAEKFTADVHRYMDAVLKLRIEGSEEEIRLAQFKEILGREGYFFDPDEIEYINTNIGLDTKFKSIVKRLKIATGEIDSIFRTMNTFIVDKLDADDWEMYEDCTVREMLGL